MCMKNGQLRKHSGHHSLETPILLLQCNVFLCKGKKLDMCVPDLVTFHQLLMPFLFYRHRIHYMRFEFLVVVTMKISAFWGLKFVLQSEFTGFWRNLPFSPSQCSSSSTQNMEEQVAAKTSRYFYQNTWYQMKKRSNLYNLFSVCSSSHYLFVNDICVCKGSIKDQFSFLEYFMRFII